MVFDAPAGAVLTIAQITGRACVHCGTETGPLHYAGWMRVPLAGGARTSSPVMECGACRG